MSAAPEGPRYKHGLSFLATIAFAGGFFGARLFHLAFPSIMVITQGIHFHHFWYGLTMMSVAGWLGIAYHNERLERVYSVVFGVGAGFVGDEVGLLLTFGDYNNELTLDFFVAAICFIVLIVLLTKYWKQIENEALRLSGREHLSHLGVFLLGFSTLLFAFGAWPAGVLLALAGGVLFVMAYERRRVEERIEA